MSEHREPKGLHMSLMSRATRPVRGSRQFRSISLAASSVEANRYKVRIEIAVTHSRQTRGTSSNRHKFRGSRRRECCEIWSARARPRFRILRAVSQVWRSMRSIRWLLTRACDRIHSFPRIFRLLQQQEHGPEDQECYKKKDKSSLMMEIPRQEAGVHVDTQESQGDNPYPILQDRQWKGQQGEQRCLPRRPEI